MNYPELHEANASRTRTAAARTVDQARVALSIVTDSTRAGDYWRTILEARIDNPDKSLAQIAETLGLTKHAYSAALRRALRYAMSGPRRERYITNELSA